MIKDKVTMQDLLLQHLNAVGLEGVGLEGFNVMVTSRDFYAGAAAMASQFATNGVLYIQTPSPAETQNTGEPQGSAEGRGDES